MHVLLLAYYFPPDGGPGAPRPISFARHLQAHGVRVTVLTRHPPHQRQRFEPADAAALATLARLCRIVRTPADATGPDAVAAAMVAAGIEVAAEERPDVVLATMSPFQLWPAAAGLGRRLGVPAVADLRDPWAFDGVQDHRTVWHWWRERAAMRRMFATADGVVANTPEAGRLFAREAPHLADGRLTTITNGWDAGEFGELPQVPPGDSLVLLHAGSFLCDPLYAHERPLRRCLGWLRHRCEPLLPSGRTPVHLLGALAKLRQRGAPAGTEVRLRCVGMTERELERCVQDSGVADAVELLSYAPHAELIAAIRRADALFLTLHGLPPGHRSRIVPGKTYEYLASGRPILAGLPDGDARDFVTSSPRAFVARPTDEDELADRIVALHAGWRAGRFVAPELPPDVGRFERGRLARDLAAFLQGIVARGRRR